MLFLDFAIRGARKCVGEVGRAENQAWSLLGAARPRPAWLDGKRAELDLALYLPLLLRIVVGRAAPQLDGSINASTGAGTDMERASIGQTGMARRKPGLPRDLP